MPVQNIRDIATLAGVSPGTVSRVLNQKDRVHPETRRRILAVIARTGYCPSALGRSLKARQSSSILLTLGTMTDPYCAAVAKEVSHACRQQGFRTLLGDLDYQPSLEAGYLRDLPTGYVDGLIASPLPGSDNVAWFQQLVRLRFPLVLIDNDVPEAGARCVKYDDRAAAEMAVAYLVQRGHRQIAFAGWQMEYQTVRDRYQGYVGGLEKRGLAARPEFLVVAPPRLAEWEFLAAGQRLFCGRKHPPTAILAVNEIVAVGWMHALVQLGKRIPQDVAVISIGDTAAPPIVPVPLTTIALPQKEAAVRATELLLELIRTPRREKRPQKVLLAPQLIVRGSA